MEQEQFEEIKGAQGRARAFISSRGSVIVHDHRDLPVGYVYEEHLTPLTGGAHCAVVRRATAEEFAACPWPDRGPEDLARLLRDGYYYEVSFD